MFRCFKIEPAVSPWQRHFLRNPSHRCYSTVVTTVTSQMAWMLLLKNKDFLDVKISVQFHPRTRPSKRCKLSSHGATKSCPAPGNHSIPTWSHQQDERLEIMNGRGHGASMVRYSGHPPEVTLSPVIKLD